MGHPSAQLESSLLSSLAISFTHPSILLFKMKTSCLIASLLVVGASAFAPAKQSAASTSLSGYKEDVGATAPLGFFDPLNLSNDSTDQETYNRMRAAEVRHGRVAMLAVVGWLYTAAGNRLPGLESIGFGFKAFDVASWQALSLEDRSTVPLTLGTVLLLTLAMNDMTGESQSPGDYRNGIDFGWDERSEEWKENKRNIELNNGRAAQMGILGIMVHEQLGNLNDIGLPQP